jgi:hypothetical protein
MKTKLVVTESDILRVDDVKLDPQAEADMEVALSFIEARIGEALAAKADKERIPGWLR